MAELPHMPISTDALLSDAGDLPNVLFGAYCRLLFRWWRERAMPEPNEKRLARWAGLTTAEFEDLKEFLTLTDAGWTQKRLFETYAKMLAKSEQAKEAAASRWSSGRNSERNADASKNDAARNANQIHDSIPYGIHHRDDAGVDVPRETNRGKRLSEDWEPPSEFIEWAVENENLTVEEAHREADQFRDYWIAETGSKAAKRDWFATWRNRVRAVAPRIRKARASGANGGSGGGYARHADPVEVRNRLLRELAEKEDVSTDGRELRSVAGR